VNVIFEGDRLFNAKLLEKLSDWFPNDLKILILRVQDSTLDRRHVYRNDNQNDKFKESRKTKISNIQNSLVLMGYIETMVNENFEHQSNIIEHIKKFFNWSE
jgi:hypothetical protein